MKSVIQYISMYLLLAVSFITIFCSSNTDTQSFKKEGASQLNIKQSNFGTTAEGEKVSLFTLTNSNGIKATITNYGGIVVSLLVPDKDGVNDDIILGYDTLEEYFEDSAYLGALIGRYANRIAKGKFSLEGVAYNLATNNGENHLHGGIKGFDKVVWDADHVTLSDAVGINLTYVSPDGEEGYPGELSSTVTYLLTEHDELKILYNATTNKPTVINLTNHSYFNLAGKKNRDILNHELMLAADLFTPVDAGLIPTGELAPVIDSPMNFTQSKSIGKDIAKVTGGYDHNYVLNIRDGSLALAARVYEPESGRAMDVLTTEPGIQFYSGNFLDGSLTGKYGITYYKHFGFCLETQHFPDSPNQPGFPSTILDPGKTYSQETIFRFYTK